MSRVKRSVLSRTNVWHSTRACDTPPGVEPVGPRRLGRHVRSTGTIERDNRLHEEKRQKIHDGARSALEAARIRAPDPGQDDADWFDTDEPFSFDAIIPAADREVTGLEDTVLSTANSASGFLPSSVPFKARDDTRTRAEQIRNEHTAWAAILPRLVTQYLQWKHAKPNETPADAHACNSDDGANDGVNTSGGHWFTVNAVRDTDFVRDLPIAFCPGEPPVLALMRCGLLACTPKEPSVAISIGLLEFYHRLRRHAPRLGVQPFVRAICDRFGVVYRPHLREQFAQAFDVYLAIRRETDQRIATALGRDGPNWRVLNSCPSCTYQLAHEEPLAIGGLVAVDGGQSLKRSAAAGHADERALVSEYAIPPAQVDLYANEVARRVQAGRKPAKDTDEQQWNIINESGEPGDDAPTPSVCSQRWKNAKSEHFKTAPGLFEQAGIFIYLCRHGFVLWYTEMVRSGELAKYGLGILSQMLSVGIRDRYIGYDIGCAFQGTVSRSSLGTRARLANIFFGLNSFHGYGHNRLCQLKHHPVYRKGFGLEDLETCERFFSASNAVAPLVRHASHFHYVQFLDLFLAQWDSDKYMELSKFIYNNVVQAYRIIGDMAATVKAFQDTTGYTNAQIEGWVDEERDYLESLKVEPERDVLEMDYVEHLEELADLESQLRACHVALRTGLPPPPLSARQIEREDLSATDVRRLNKKRQDTYKKYSAALDTVVALEAALRVDDRWTPTSELFLAAQKKTVERNWRRALDRLEFLMVQRMFELAKSHAIGTGYKLREAIGKGLKARSRAIRTAVTKYNSAAAALDPPAQQVDFTTLMEWTQLQEFELLRHTRGGDLEHRAWAQPANRLTAMKYHKVARAREELLRCRIEMRRLLTAMGDDEAHMRATLAALSSANDLLAHELHEAMRRRVAVNDMHRHRLATLARRFPAFADCLVPGDPLERRYGPAAPGRAPDGIEEQAQDELDVDEQGSDEEEGVLRAIEDFFVELT